VGVRRRRLLRCEGLTEPDGRHVEYIFDSAFREFGLPEAIRSDNGPPSPRPAPAASRPSMSGGCGSAFASSASSQANRSKTAARSAFTAR
jgi:hypothetical protein